MKQLKIGFYIFVRAFWIDKLNVCTFLKVFIYMLETFIS